MAISPQALALVKDWMLPTLSVPPRPKASAEFIGPWFTKRMRHFFTKQPAPFFQCSECNHVLRPTWTHLRTTLRILSFEPPCRAAHRPAMAPQRNIGGKPYYHRVEWWKDEFGQWFKRTHYVGLWQARAWKTVHCMVLVLGPTPAITPPFLILARCGRGK